MERPDLNNKEGAREIGAEYWYEVEALANEIARVRRELPELEQKAEKLRHHKSDPPPLRARIILPEGAEAYLSRNHEYQGSAPQIFEADGMEKLESGEYVFYNETDYYWLVITSLPEAPLRIEPIFPEDTQDPL